MFWTWATWCIKTAESGKIDYKVHLEVKFRGKRRAAAPAGISSPPPEKLRKGSIFAGNAFGRQSSGRLWVTVELNIPKNYSVDVVTGGGNIQADEINGRASLVTSGGTIIAGKYRWCGASRNGRRTHTLKNVTGDLTANFGRRAHHHRRDFAAALLCIPTAVTFARSRLTGRRIFPPAAATCFVEHSGSELVAETVGGQIEVGETAGLVKAKTGGGGIRVVRVSGPTNLETVGGSIYLTASG